ncbi:unnamed protein product [Durusdinium trenchii]|uniref:Transmembrane protein n=1 Tax=Durusdinium trenchii TaxID=1381693 RepID=A0ABP0N5C7_9DINO
MALLDDGDATPPFQLADPAPAGEGGRVGGRCWGQPRIRTDWEQIIDGEDPLCGRVTTQEAQWAVVVTMGISSMREKLLAKEELLWYTLSFYCFWGVVMASINYSSRFNDDDSFHKVFWGAFLVLMALQVAYLNHDMSGLAMATAGLYLLVSIAHLRVGWFLRRARAICFCLGLQTFLGGVLFVVIAILSQGKERLLLAELPCEAILLSVNVVLEPVCVLLFMALNRKNHGHISECWDVPFSIDYIEARFESLHMTVIVCSFLFPIGLSGNFFASSRAAAVRVLAANLYALILKLVVFDMHDIHNLSDGRSRHAIRRSRRSTIFYIYSFPLGLLGISFTGVGFMASVKGHEKALTRWLLCFGPALTWSTLSLTKALHSPLEPVVHWAKVAAMLACALAFLLPWLLDFTVNGTLILVMAIVSLALLSQLILERWLSEKKDFPSGWQWKRPRLLKDWTTLKEVIGPCLTSHEHFFTIMLAVVIYKLNENLGETKHVEIWVLLFFSFYIIFSASFVYAARFNDNDGAHKLIWSLYQFQLLFMLEGLSTDDEEVQFNILALSSAAMFLLLSLGFFGRAAVGVRRARCWMGSFAVLYLFCDLIGVFGFFDRQHSYLLLFLVVAVVMLFDPFVFFVAKMFRAKEAWVLPMNMEYIISRFDGLILEVLGVAMIVPCAFYPHSFRYPRPVFCFVVLNAALAVLFKIAVLDVEPIWADRHAMRRSNWRAHLFFFLNPFILLGLCGIGAAMPLLTKSVGDFGYEARDMFAQHLASWSSFLTWMALAATKMLHKPMRSTRLHCLKVFVKALGATLMLLPVLILHLRDVIFLLFLGTVTCVVTFSLMIISSEAVLAASSHNELVAR